MKPIPYHELLHSKLRSCQESTRNNRVDNHYTVNFGDEHHWIFFKKAKYLREKNILKQILIGSCEDIEQQPKDIDTIYKILKGNEYNNLDIARHNDGRITYRKILSNNASQDAAKKALIACKSRKKLIILDHIKFDTKDDAYTFVNHLYELTNTMECRVLVVFHKEHYTNFEEARNDPNSPHFKTKEWRLHPLNPSAITDLIEKSGGRQLRYFDWDLPPQLVDLQNIFVGQNFLDWRICNWASRAPKLVTDIVHLMDKRVPLWVIEYICANCEKHKQTSKSDISHLLQPYDNSLLKNKDTKEDAIRALIQFIPQLRLIMQQWEDADNDEKEETNNNDDDTHFQYQENTDNIENNNNNENNENNENNNYNYNYNNNNNENNIDYKPSSNNNNIDVNGNSGQIHTDSNGNYINGNHG